MVDIAIVVFIIVCVVPLIVWWRDLCRFWDDEQDDPYVVTLVQIDNLDDNSTNKEK